MKKLSLATIVVILGISLVSCTNSGVTDNGNGNKTESNVQNSSENNTTNNQNNVNTTANISEERAKEIALSHAGLGSSQVTFKRTELDFDNGIKKYEVEFYYNNREYSYEIDANNGNILSYEQD